MWKTWALAPFAALLFLVAVSCVPYRSYVWVKQDVYNPKASAKLADYKDRAIFLANFENRAENTTLFYYFDPDHEMYYEGAPTLHSYLWYCFEKALQRAGVLVYRDTAPPTVPEFQLSFNSWSDEVFKCYVRLLKNGMIQFQKEFRITFQPPAHPDPEAMEVRAYEDMDKIIETIFLDPALKEAFDKLKEKDGR